jgi:hypothetical protein
MAEAVRAGSSAVGRHSPTRMRHFELGLRPRTMTTRERNALLAQEFRRRRGRRRRLNGNGYADVKATLWDYSSPLSRGLTRV